jgi:hypothetical protein
MSTKETNIQSDSPGLRLWSLSSTVFDQRVLLPGIFLLIVGVMFFYRPFSQPVGGDTAIYDYIAQSILRGQVPYRDVVDIKGPGSVYLSALSIACGRVLGMQDVNAVRLLNIVLLGLFSALTFLVVLVYLRSRIAAIIAAILPFVSTSVVDMMIGGTQPKLPMIVFGLLTLLLIARDRPFWAGFCSMLSCLCWQPGLMFAGVAFLIFSHYLTRWRDGSALKVVIGAAIPLAVVVVYFYWKGALGDLWNYAMVYNYSVFAPEAKRSLVEAMANLWKTLRRNFESEVLFVVLSAVGLLIFCAERLRAKFKEGFSSELFRDAIAIPPLVYFAFCLINFQAGPDLIPFLPFIGIFAAWLFVKAAQAISAIKMARFAAYLPRAETLIPQFVLAVILALVVTHAAGYRMQGTTLQEQEEEVKTLAGLLNPDDKMYVHGTVGLLVLLNKPNLNPYVFLDWNMDTFVAARKYGGSFKALIDEMEAQTPKIVSISRIKAVTHGEDFEQWVSEHYEEVPLKTLKNVYVRKQPF